MKRLILHIGSEKTGTTSIQNFLASNRGQLEQQGVIYPNVGFSNTAHFSLVAPFHHFDNDGKPLEFAPLREYKPREEWAPVKRIFDNWDDVTVILSAEHFSSRLKDKGIKELKKVVGWACSDVEIKIIFYVRRQDNYFQSWYSTHIKAGGTLTLDEAFRSRLNQKWFYDYYHIASAWEREFGKVVDVAVYENGQLEGGLINDFLKRAGVSESSAFTYPEKVSNSSWPYSFLQVARMINIFNKENPVPRRYQILEKLSEYFDPDVNQPLSPERRSKIMSLYSESNSSLAKGFLGREDGILFLDSGFDDLSWVEPESISLEMMIPVLVGVADNLLDKGKK